MKKVLTMGLCLLVAFSFSLTLGCQKAAEQASEIKDKAVKEAGELKDKTVETATAVKDKTVETATAVKDKAVGTPAEPAKK